MTATVAPRPFRNTMALWAVVLVLSFTPTTGHDRAAAAERCGHPYDRIALFGRSPTTAARRSAFRRAEGIDWYTGSRLTGPVEVDHVYPLARAAESACRWSPARRHRFANDPDELVATTRHVNRIKSDLTPGQWLPADRSHACDYGRRFEAIAAKWSLPVSSDDITARSLACGDSADVFPHAVLTAVRVLP